MAKNGTLEKLPNGKSPKLFLTDVRPNKTEKHPIRFQRMGLRLRPRWGLQRSPDPTRGYSLRGPKCKERERKGREERGGVERSRRWMAPFQILEYATGYGLQ